MCRVRHPLEHSGKGYLKSRHPRRKSSIPSAISLTTARQYLKRNMGSYMRRNRKSDMEHLKEGGIHHPLSNTWRETLRRA